ncbi:hypothetical protein Scep_006862 [Stephania cephalantha]|uniref:Uncharacterized protein n=1 Tax=Stephania cephalantha TaxID=152367 RepID=A0AAP0PNB1_9MAGN
MESIMAGGRRGSGGTGREQEAEAEGVAGEVGDTGKEQEGSSRERETGEGEDLIFFNEGRNESLLDLALPPKFDEEKDIKPTSRDFDNVITDNHPLEKVAETKVKFEP